MHIIIIMKVTHTKLMCIIEYCAYDVNLRGVLVRFKGIAFNDLVLSC